MGSIGILNKAAAWARDMRLKVCDLSAVLDRKQTEIAVALCYTSGISTHEGTGIAMAEGLLWSLPHNGTRLYGTTIEYVVSCTRYHPCINATHNSMN